MSIRKLTTIQLVCDRCDPGHQTVMPVDFHPGEEPELLSMAKVQRWTTDGEKHHCRACSKVWPLVDPNAPPAPVPMIEGQEVLVP